MRLQRSAVCILIVTCAVIFVATPIGFNLWEMKKDPDVSLWPCVTRCRICGERIWKWQEYERRSWNVDADKEGSSWVYPNKPTYRPGVPTIFGVHVGGSSIVHKSCKGNPKVEIGIEFGPKKQDDHILQPKDTSVDLVAFNPKHSAERKKR